MEGGAVVLDLIYPEKGAKYLYFAFQQAYGIPTNQYVFVLAIPLRRDGVGRIRLTDTSRFEQGRERSYNGATSVRHFDCDGQIEIDFDPDRAAKKREHRKRYRGRGLSGASLRCFTINGYMPFSPSAQKSSDMEAFSFSPCYREIRYTRWDSSSQNLDHFREDGTIPMAVVFGFRDVGTFSYRWERAWAKDSCEVNISWELKRALGKLKITATVKADAQDGGDYRFNWTQQDIVNSGPDRYYGEGHYVSVATVEPSFSDDLRWSFMNNARNPHQKMKYTADDFQTDYSGRSVHAETEVRAYRKNTGEWEHPRRDWNLRYSQWIDYGPDWRGGVEFLPEDRIDDLYADLKRLADWNVGSQRCAISYQEVENYNLGFKPEGKDRGGYTIWTPMQKEAIENNRHIQTNVWMFLQDIFNAAKDWKNLSEAFRADAEFFSRNRNSDLKKIHWIKLFKNGSNTYLPILYGWRLTQSEAESLGEDIEKILSDGIDWTGFRYLGPIRRSETVGLNQFVEGISATETFCWQADVRPLRDTAWYAVTDELGFWLSLSDMWDWIKYSFVVNWLTKIPLQLLEWYDFQGWKQNYQCFQVQRSNKMVGTLPAFTVIPSYACAYPDELIDFKYYERYWNEIFDPVPSFLSGSGNTLLSHSVEVAALVVQRL
jgi:hypothetical protein